MMALESASSVSHNPQDLWSYLRDNMSLAVAPTSKEQGTKTRRDTAAIDIDSLASQAINYPLTIKQGFQFKYRLRTKHNLLAMVCHEKIPRHREEGHYEDGMDQSSSKHGKPAKQDSAIQLLADDTTELPYHHSPLPFPPDIITPIANTTSPISSKSQTKQTQYTFVLAETNKAIKFWDTIKCTPNHPRFMTRIAKKVEKICFISRYSVYAGCLDEKAIRFYNPRFELLQTFKTPHHIQFVLYNPILHQLIGVSSHEIMTWDMKAIVLRGSLTISMELCQTTEITLPSNEWITNAMFDSYNQHLYIIVNSKILVYNSMSTTLPLVDQHLQIAHRQVTCLVNYHPYGFTVVGSKDGSIKVLNSANVVVHEFWSQYKAVTALAVYPYGPVVVATSMDKSIRMYSLRSFKEVYCLQLQDQPLSMRILDENTMYVTCIDAVMVWSLNHINTQFCTINAKVLKIQTVESKGSPTRILCRSEDEVIRLISPTTGKVITTCLPLFEMDKVIDVIYAAKANKMFLLIENGEIWIIGSSVNPCVVLDIWRPDSTGEDICSLCIVEGFCQITQSNETEGNRKSIQNDSSTSVASFSMLMSGTKNGQLLIYNLVGDVVQRQQLHFGKITCIVNDTEQNILLTAGEDKMIHISQFNPLAKESMFDICISVEAEQIPRDICIGLSHFCVTYDDASVHIYEFDVNRKTSKHIANHSRSDDHTDTITTIASIKKLGLFVTSSVDSTIKIWDLQNNLVREIQFHEPITSLAIANPRGDILIDMDNRIDMIHHTLYLPPLYLKAVENLKWDTNILMDPYAATIEEPIPFDEDFNFKQNFASSHVNDTGGSCIEGITTKEDIDLSWLEGKKQIESSFVTMNFAIDSYSEAKIKTRLRLSAIKRKEMMKENERTYGLLMEKLAVIRERRQRIMESARHRMEVEQLETEKRDNILHEEFEKFQRYQELLQTEPTYLQKTRWQKDSFYKMTVENDIGQGGSRFKLFDTEEVEGSHNNHELSSHPVVGIDSFELVERPEDQLPFYILSELLPGTPDSMDLEYAIEAMSEESIFEEAPIQAEEAPQLIIEETRRKSIVKLVKLAIAPDGILPNSIINSTIQNWKDNHPGFAGQLSFADFVSMLIKKKKWPQKQAKSNEEDEKKKEEFKNKIQEMLKKKKEEERIAAEKEEAAQRALEEAGKSIVTIEVPVDQLHTPAAHLPSRGGRPPQVKLPPPPKKVEHYPKVIEKGLTYPWFPQEEVFYPQIEKAQNIYIKKDKKKEEELRKLKVEPTVEVLSAIVLELFKKEAVTRTKLEMLDYITWMFEEFGNKDTTLLIRYFCRYLQCNPYLEIEADEVRLRTNLINYLPKFGLSQLELLPTMIMQTLSPVETIKDFALQSLFSMGLFDDLHELFLTKMKEIIQPAEAANKAKAEAKANTPTAKQLALLGSALVTPAQRAMSVNGTPPFFTRTGSVNGLGGTGLQRAASGAVGSNTPMEVRNSLMTWLRKTLRKYLIRTAKDDETLQKLREMNESGLVDRNKKNIEDKEKEDLEMVALRAKEMKESKLLSSMSVASSRMSIGAAPPSLKKGNKRQSDGATDKAKSVVIAGKKGAKRVSVAIAPAPAKLQQKKPMSASSVEILHKHAPVNTAQVAISRSALIILQTPNILDFIGVINLFCISLNRKIKKEEKEYLERMAREAKMAEEMRIEKEKMEAMAEFLRVKEAERLARALLLKEKIAAKEAEKAAALAAAQLALMPKPKKVWKGFTGGTHVSKCHGSRETLETTLTCMHRHAHSLGTTMLTNHFQAINRSMPVEHIKLSPFSLGADSSLDNSQASMELPPLRQSSHHRHQELPHPPTLPILMANTPKKTISKPPSSWRLPSFYDAPDALDYVDQNVKNSVTVSQELEYIRQGPQKIGPILNSIGLPNEYQTSAFNLGKKYFMVDLADPDDIDDMNSCGEIHLHHGNHSRFDHNKHSPKEKQKRKSKETKKTAEKK
ncbi:hypothetical protein BDR26DRAFT_871157, partial [Obelidium mucronatum]